MDKRIQCVSAETPSLLEAAAVPGLTVALLENGITRDVFCFGMTKPQGGMPITEKTIFKCASLSKQVLLYAALKTIEAGKLDLDQPLALYLEKPFEADDSDLARITARHVLTHTAGWRNWPPDGELITRIAPLGERWTYSGMGFLYLQEVLEAIWSEPAADYLQRLVLDPLDMPQSSFLWKDEYNKTAVDGFDPNGDIPDESRWYPDEVNTGGSLHTTAREYARLLEAFLQPSLCERHPDVCRRQIGIDERLGWSLGWGIADDDILWQWGYHVAFSAFAALAPTRGQGIVVLTNGTNGQRIYREWVSAWLEADLPDFPTGGV